MSSKIQEELSQSSSATISKRTIRMRLVEMGFKSRSALRKPPLTAAMKKKRMDWALAHRSWTVDNKKHAIFSDESKFKASLSNKAVVKRRKSGEQNSRKCIWRTVKHPPFVIVWGCMTYNGVGNFVIVNGMMNSIKYKSVTIDEVLPIFEEMTGVFSDPIFQDDSAPCHRANIASPIHISLNIFLYKSINSIIRLQITMKQLELHHFPGQRIARIKIQ